VLVVEGDDSFAEALRELLEADGRLEVAGRARDGQESIEVAEALRLQSISSARAASTQTSSKSLSLPRITVGAAGAGAQRAAEQRSSQRTSLRTTPSSKTNDVSFRQSFRQAPSRLGIYPG
jgi:DNA-binding NarL/FixJ family response regulator